jgi:hypothetical protein
MTTAALSFAVAKVREIAAERAADSVEDLALWYAEWFGALCAHALTLADAIDSKGDDAS